MKCIHFCSYLVCTPLYLNLFEGLRQSVVSQVVVVPQRKSSIWEPPQTTVGGNIQFVCRKYQIFWDRILFRRKIRRGINQFSHLLAADFKEENVLAHAHTLFSDGILCWELGTKMGARFVVTVRATDVDVFWKYMPHLRGLAKHVLVRAGAISFLSPSIRDRFRAYLGREFWEEIEPKVRVIPNGIDDFWFANLQSEAIAGRRNRVLYVGTFIRRKNIGKLIRAVEILRRQGWDLELKLIGGCNKEVQTYSRKFERNWLMVQGRLSDKSCLLAEYRAARVFAMPSRAESFGLVYAEALSQGLPIVCGRSEGFDGWLGREECGTSVDVTDVFDIAAGIRRALERGRSAECAKVADQFRWGRVCADYLEMYKKVVYE